MATHTVQQSGGEFTTLASALADAGTAAGDTIEISGSWTVDDTACCTVSDDGLTIQAIGDSKCLGYPSPSTGWYRLRTATASDDALDTGAYGITIDGLEIRNNADSTGNQFGIIGSLTSSKTVTVKNCLTYRSVGWTGGGLGCGIQHTIATAGTLTVTYENCIAYGWWSAGFRIQNSGATTNADFYANCLTAWYNGQSDSTHGGIHIRQTNSGTPATNAYYFNCIAVGNGPNDYTESGTGASEIVFDIHNCIDSDGSIASRGGDTNCLASRTETDNASPGAGDWVVFQDITNSPYDLRLKHSSENDAKDMHATSSGAGCTMPTMDIAGTRRPANTNYDCGAFELVISPNVYNAITLAENITERIDLNPNVFKAIATTESVTSRVDLNPNIFKSITVVETITSRVDLNPNVFKDISITENITASNLELFANVFKSISVTEYNERYIEIDLVAFSTITVSEDKTIQVSSISSLMGSVCWGHDTGVEEDNIVNLATLSGTGTISGSGDDEILTLSEGEFRDSVDINIGSYWTTIAWNKYKSGDTPTIKYKTAASQEDLEVAAWTDYVDQFLSLGWVRIRVEG